MCFGHVSKIHVYEICLQSAKLLPTIQVKTEYSFKNLQLSRCEAGVVHFIQNYCIE